ncbi:hypothetical protein NQZ68_033599 [Dissostichus eleginoides]|nr:hypothetical protein NQZ68_033599 [Dissostichus eleginoides]
MSHEGRLLLLRDWFCYQKGTGLNDAPRRSSGDLLVRAGVTENSEGSPGFIKAAAGSSLSLDLLWCRAPLRLSTLITVKFIKDKINMRENTAGCSARTQSGISSHIAAAWLMAEWMVAGT